jgi:hypothetical protein
MNPHTTHHLILDMMVPSRPTPLLTFLRKRAKKPLAYIEKLQVFDFT